MREFVRRLKQRCHCFCIIQCCTDANTVDAYLENDDQSISSKSNESQRLLRQSPSR